MQDVDTSTTFEVRQRPGLMWLAAGFMAIPVAFLLWTVVITWPHADTRDRLINFALMLPFAVTMAFAVHKAAQGRRVEIILSPEGYRDLRRGGVLIPWTGVTRIWSLSGRFASLRLGLTPEVAEEIYGSPGLWRTLRTFYEISMSPVYSSTIVGMDIKPPQLELVARRYHECHGNKSPGRDAP